MSSQEFQAARGKLFAYVKTQLIGPMEGEEEEINDAPHKRYLSGTLFPPAVVIDESDKNAGEDSTTEALSNDFKPSSFAISFAARNTSIFNVQLSAGRYSKGLLTSWRRKPVNFTYQIDLSTEKNKSIPLFNDDGKLTIAIRPYKGGKIVTVAFSNQIKSGDSLKPEDCFYQSKISIFTLKGKFEQYPSSDRFKLDDEQKELSLTYRNRIPWAMGHGVAVNWDTTSGESVPTQLTTEMIPSHEVKGFTTALDIKKFAELTDEMLSIHRIADVTNVPQGALLDSYKKLINAYSSWIDELEAEELDSRYLKAKERIIARLRSAAKRMNSGIFRLKNDPLAMQAFRLANKAMLMQMIHSGKAYSGCAKEKNWGYQTPDYFSKDKIGQFKWRPFQLAFQLLVLESMIPSSDGTFSNTHSDVDLLWFPTGGGKTEAYLAIAAWEMIYRKLKYGESGGGTSVIKRYTLRLLTSQQFQRAGTLICALEVLRQQEETSLFGTEKFSLGLWVGAKSSPNNFKDAEALFKKERESHQPENPFPLKACPWCGTSIFPSSFSDKSQNYGVKCDAFGTFEFFCPSDACEFHQHLPVQVVDEALYQLPPSLLIGTIDKFARLTWKAEAATFFGNNVKRPPSLIIQDELHLISGPLGTIAGIYEAGFDSMMAILGHKPKVIAATATIRSADQQVKRLFGREVAIFPPSGTDESDSFFSKEDKDSSGRLYVGVMPSGHSGQTGLVQLAAALLQAPNALEFDGTILDSYWTLPIYHNSRRELGKTMTMSRDDIPARIKVISKDKASARVIDLVEELSANVKGPRIPEVLAKLGKELQNAEEVVDILPCTNMISVGVDIARLGQMLIAGQPKATSEYIQASSRVGRDKKRPPGIVFTLYSANKPRDRSHYESFKSYHQALYRYVEPTSVTPWAIPAVERALHAALIAIVRVTGYLRGNQQAEFFDKNSAEVKQIHTVFVARIKQSMDGMDSSEKEKVFIYLDTLMNEWHRRANESDRPITHYSESGKQFRPLFKSFETEKHPQAWKTLNSMRSVDTETHILVRGEQNGKLKS